jgi:DNA invertase Pin-like site-specific DNA recombinase
MFDEMSHRKVTASHLKREACLYIRQSSMKQVLDNHESTLRQYDFKKEAIRLGWRAEQVVVIDNDQGHSGAQKSNRDGFRDLVSQVSMGKAGIVMGLEVSRLARNNADWHNLLELCAFSDTLILDQDGLYDANSFNDRLLLGLKGAMSEAELHVLKSRLQGGLWNKARRGELRVRLPSGFVYDLQNRVVLDPDKQVQESIRLFFETFQKIGSACGTIRELKKLELKMPTRIAQGPRRGELLWQTPTHTLALRMLHQPRYAGAFCFGKTKTRMAPDGSTHMTLVKKDEWPIVIKNAHPGYISWTEYESNLRQLQENSTASNMNERHVPPREGNALLQGLVICGNCGKSMTIRYAWNTGRQVPVYVCQRDAIEYDEEKCQYITGTTVDAAIEKLVIENVNTNSIQVAIDVQKELSSRMDETDKLWKLEMERARYDADLAQRRFMKVDPDNRLVADALEADWNEKLRILDEAKSKYEKQREKELMTLNGESQKKLMSLPTDFARLWRSKNTGMRDRKRMLKLLVEDVTLTKEGKLIDVFVRFRGGKTENFTIPAPLRAGEMYKTPTKVLNAMDKLLDDFTIGQIADILNAQKLSPGKGEQFTPKSVYQICRNYRLKTRKERLREKGFMTLEEMAELMNVSNNTIQIWKRNGMLKAYPYNNKNECLFEPPGEGSPAKQQGLPYNQRKQFQQFNAD